MVNINIVCNQFLLCVHSTLHAEIIHDAKLGINLQTSKFLSAKLSVVVKYTKKLLRKYHPFESSRYYLRGQQAAPACLFHRVEHFVPWGGTTCSMAWNKVSPSFGYQIPMPGMVDSYAWNNQSEYLLSPKRQIGVCF